MARTKTPSRATRWSNAISKCNQHLAELREALEELQEVHQEYVDWKDNMSENLQSTPVYEKLEAVTEIDVEGAVSYCDDIEGVLNEADGADLPLGFGRD